MDTPQKAQIAAPRANFEDSPVFNYINSLSPIKPVKSTHITQTFQSLSFSSLPSIFTSPHVSSQKESKFLRRHSISDPSKPEFIPENSNARDALDIAQLYDSSSLEQENYASVVPPIEHVNFVTELPEKLNYGCGTPESDPTPCCGSQIECGLEVSGKSLPEGEAKLNAIYQPKQNKKATESDWENLITDSSDLLIFNSPIDTNAFKELMEGSMDCHDGHEMPMDHTGSKEMVAYNLNRGMLRRCLDFEAVGTRKNYSDDSSESKDKKLIPGGDSSRRVLPGIGLHLNSLAIASKDSKNVEVEVMSSKISLSTPVSSFQSPNTGQELNESLTLASEQEMDRTENAVALVEDVSQTSIFLIAEEFSNSSPEKKRRRLEGETEGCKRCNCKKSKCLKLYCECFAAGVYCIDSCSCQECFNKPTHEDTVLATRKQIESRNPLAFAPKVIRGSESVAEISDDSNKTPASARHKRGCNCKKSNCLKKYCECYQGGVGCSVNCRCEGCKNVFGRKDGLGPPEAEETGEEDNRTENASQKPELSNIEEPNLSSTPQTPLSLRRPLLRLPFSSKGKPPRSSLGIGSSSRTYTNQKYSKPNILRPEHKFENQLQSIPDDEIPEILTKTSPNSKRVSPPHSIIRNGRKVILQSIPSFPSLNTHH